MCSAIETGTLKSQIENCEDADNIAIGYDYSKEVWQKSSNN